LAVRTKTAALSAMFTLLAGLFVVSVAADFGLRSALEDRRWDLVALRLLPIVVVHGALGASFERSGRPWVSRPLYLAAAGTFVLVLELMALDGRLFQHLGITLAPWQGAGVSDPTLLDTVAAMTINGALFYAAASLLLRRGSAGAVPAAQLLIVIAPFALLHPLGYLVRQGDYSPRFDWVYAACALGIMLLSQRRQRRSFYYAGLLNLGVALFFIGDHRSWFDRPGWGIGVILAGLLVLAVGFLLDRAQRR
jgi:hypothetical protein